MNFGPCRVPDKVCAVLSCWFIAGSSIAQSISFDYSSVGGALIEFQGHGTGGSLSVASDPSTGFEFQIANATLPSLNGLFGRINGTFMIGTPITTAFGSEEASISGWGTMTLVDGTSELLATIAWNTAISLGPLGALNYDVAESPPNLSKFLYLGTTSSPLYQLSNVTSGTNVLDFTFSSPESLSTLVQSGSSAATTFSGSFEAIPEPATFASILGFLTIAFAGWRRLRGARLTP